MLENLFGDLFGNLFGHLFGKSVGGSFEEFLSEFSSLSPTVPRPIRQWALTIDHLRQLVGVFYFKTSVAPVLNKCLNLIAPRCLGDKNRIRPKNR